MPFYLSQAQIDSMRLDAAKTYNSTCVIKSPSLSVDSSGRQSQTFTPVIGGTVACDFEQKISSVIETGINAGKILTMIKTTVTLPFDAPIDSHYRITHNAIDYKITSLMDDSDWPIEKVCVVEKVE